MNIAIIGAGLIGGKRAAALDHFPEDTLRVVCDVDLARAQELAGLHGAEAVADWHDAVQRDDVDIVVNAAINAVLEPITVAAVITSYSIHYTKLYEISAKAMPRPTLIFIVTMKVPQRVV